MCRYRNESVVEVLTWTDQDFWSEMLELTTKGALRLAHGRELKWDMWCLVEVRENSLRER